MLALGRSRNIFRSKLSGLFSTLAEPKLSIDEFRTNENNPANHRREHIGKYYRIDEATKKKLFSNGGFIRMYEKQIRTFAETCVMIRPQAVEIMEYIQRTDFTKPVNRYVLYGKEGTGKSMTIAHLAHYGYTNDFCLVHIPYVPDWYKRPKECALSAKQEGMVDTLLDSAEWLVHFKSQNSDLLNKLDARISKTYEWSKREETPAGSTFLELIDHGINRVKYATEVIATLFNEIKLASTEGKMKTMVLIDGYNCIFAEESRCYNDTKKRKFVSPDKVLITDPLKNITNYDWCNGVVVLSVDKIGMLGQERISDLPRYLLGKDGFEHLDPFVPIRTETYSDKEFNSCLDYFVERKWLQNTQPGYKDELKFLSNKNPFKIMELCNAI